MANSEVKLKKINVAAENIFHALRQRHRIKRHLTHKTEGENGELENVQCRPYNLQSRCKKRFKSCNYKPAWNEDYFETCLREKYNRSGRFNSVCGNNAVGKYEHMVDTVSSPKVTLTNNASISMALKAC